MSESKSRVPIDFGPLLPDLRQRAESDGETIAATVRKAVARYLGKSKAWLADVQPVGRPKTKPEPKENQP